MICHGIVLVSLQIGSFFNERLYRTSSYVTVRNYGRNKLDGQEKAFYGMKFLVLSKEYIDYI